MTFTQIERLFCKHQLCIASYRELPTGFGMQFHTNEGPVVNIYYTGTVHVQGTNCELAAGLAAELRSLIKQERKSNRPAMLSNLANRQLHH